MKEKTKTPSKESALWRDSYYHKLFGLKAAEEVMCLLPLFEKENPNDNRPRIAIEVLLAWATGEHTLGMAEVRKLSLDAHAAAREAKSDTARFVARAAGQAVATWHVPTHALAAFGYAGRARVASKNNSRSAAK